ncbi:MAG: indolepyruvate ferredoxin oxidoreductase subunit alpha [Candidatus Eiseniibacteriota bacterium]|nr:MAG: indolepyruvate ferredoxin oxidoreductase subunit alpha [Candidatus Eisenbacteria bacterium]
MKALLSGNEAIARGAYESSVHFAAAYPGTPSTEILENIARYKEIRSEWSTNEKVALDIAVGASYAGARVLVAMKHVGLNVASDPFMVTAFAGVTGGLVIVAADDPGMHSSQNEQDSRYFARFGKVPMLEPSDSQEAKDFVGIALKLSEEFDIPVLLRTTTRVSHGKCVVELGQRTEVPVAPYEKNARRHVVPIYGKLLRPGVEERMKRLEAFSETFPENRIEEGTGKIGVITSGIAYQYAREVLPEASFLKLGLPFPLPRKKILDFVKRFEKVYVIEELEPFLEEQIRSWGVTNLTGKEVITNIGELSPGIVEASVRGTPPVQDFSNEIDILPRPPVMCAGCPHLGVFHVLRKLKLAVTGDIGCYTLGTLPPFNAMHTTSCMGSSIGHAFGIEIAQGENLKGKVVGIIGDSTFLHAGMPALLDVVYNKGITTVIIADNKTTGMTGHQEHPGTGRTITGETTTRVNYEKLCKALGVRFVRKADPHNLKLFEETLKEALAIEEPAVVISERACAMLPTVRKRRHPIYTVDWEKCNACKLCYRFSCPCMDRRGEKPIIDPDTCVGCSLCAQVCNAEAIVLVE